MSFCLLLRAVLLETERMPNTGEGKSSFATLPANLKAVPIQPPLSAVGVEICLAVRLTPDPVAGSFVVLRQTSIATVVLGCLTDSSHRLIEWLELWLQKPVHAQSLTPVFQTRADNRLIDGEWQDLAHDFEACDPVAYIETPFVAKSLRPVRIRAKQGETGLLEHEGGGAWQLCDQDGALKSAGLHPYSVSRHRYLVAEASGQNAVYCRVTSLAENEGELADGAQLVPAAAVSAENTDGLPLFVEAPRLMVRRLAPISLEQHLSLLGGVPWPGIENGKQPISLGGIFESFSKPDYLQKGTAYLMGGKHGKTGNLLEALHLRLTLLQQMMAVVRDSTHRRQLPFLNLSPASFGVRFNLGGAGLPLFWNAHPVLAQPGDAFPLPVPNTSVRRFQRRTSGAMSIYQPESLNAAISGACTVRVLRVLPPVAEGVALEATVIARENLSVSQNSLIWIQIPLASGSVDLYGYLDQQAGLAKGEAALRTIPQRMDQCIEAALRSAEGTSFSQATFSVIPALSSPVDLYSFGVIATQMFLVNPRLTLPFALDGVLSLAREIAERGGNIEALGEDVAQAVAQDPNRLERLGPQNLLFEEISAEQAVELFPAQLWWDTLGVLIRFFPGMGPASFCRDSGDAPDAAIEAIYDSPLRQIDALLMRSRSAMLSDWGGNVEIGTVLKSVADEV